VKGKGGQLTVTRSHQVQEVARNMEEMGKKWMNDPDHTREMATSPLDRLGTCENAHPSA